MTEYTWPTIEDYQEQYVLLPSPVRFYIQTIGLVYCMVDEVLWDPKHQDGCWMCGGVGATLEDMDRRNSKGGLVVNRAS